MFETFCTIGNFFSLFTLNETYMKGGLAGLTNTRLNKSQSENFSPAGCYLSLVQFSLSPVRYKDTILRVHLSSVRD